MIKNIKNLLLKNIDSLLIFLFSNLIFTYILNFVPTDIQIHIKQIDRINYGTITYPPNFFFYIIVNFLSGFTSNRTFMIISTIIVLSFATTIKYSLSKKIILSNCNFSLIEKSKAEYKVILISILLFFCFSIPDYYNIFILKNYYLGRFPPMIWHNSTTILLFPFAILLFWKQSHFFISNYSPSKKDIYNLNLLVFLNISIKPSFIFVYIPVTFLFLIKYIKGKNINSKLIYFSPIITGITIIIIQFALIYYFQIGSIQKGQESHISIGSPFKLLNQWIPYWYIPVSILLSLLLPIISMLLFKDILKNMLFKYALILMIFGILLSGFISETGPRALHGNFMWQNIICSFLMFLATINYLTPKILTNKTEKIKIKILTTIFLIHSISGIYYLIRIIISKNYI